MEHITVVDLTQGVSGPFATRLLAQMGARVIKVERPGQGDLIRSWDNYVNGMCSGHAWVNPGKESLAVDLSTPEGREVLLRLVARADVLVENFVPGTLEKWGLAPDLLREHSPDLICCRISGFGQTGPYRDHPALDLIMQGEAGLISTNGAPDAPAKISLSVADISGAMYSVIAVLQALLHRQRGGPGQVIDLALFDTIMTWSGYFPYMWWYGRRTPGRVGLHHHTMAPYGPYRAGDGKIVIVAGGAGNYEQWRRLCECLECPEIVDDPRFIDNAGRIANREELNRCIEEALARRGRDEWLTRLLAAGIPAGALNEFDEALTHPRIAHRGLVTEVPSAVGPIKVMDYPPQMSSLRAVNDLGPPLLGEHTRAILAELDLAGETDELARRAIVQLGEPRDEQVS
ncbi:CaiB/BaiF CoA transferase family protein [Actinophytocola sp.]|uniref:CaiB/BaiF CoA transferase family protein n=1 Tax=Actinophytocola sp. TaxID=1872138 RepID=UPI003D6A070A